MLIRSCTSGEGEEEDNNCERVESRAGNSVVIINYPDP